MEPLYSESGGETLNAGEPWREDSNQPTILEEDDFQRDNHRWRSRPSTSAGTFLLSEFFRLLLASPTKLCDFYNGEGFSLFSRITKRKTVSTEASSGGFPVRPMRQSFQLEIKHVPPSEPRMWERTNHSMPALRLPNQKKGDLEYTHQLSSHWALSSSNRKVVSKVPQGFWLWLKTLWELNQKRLSYDFFYIMNIL